MSMLRAALLTISVLGGALFGIAFVLSFVRPVLVETALKDVVRRELEVRVDEKLASLDGSALARIASRFLSQNDVAARVAAVMKEMQDPDCVCRKALLGLEIFSHSAIHERLTTLIRAQYRNVVGALMREFRIFTGANALVFLLLGVITFTRRRAGLQLLLPAAVLLGAATSVALVYLFGQDWLHTIVFSDYSGFGYFAYLGIAMAFLSDVAFNRARVSTEVLNLGLNLVGAAIEVAPC